MTFMQLGFLYISMMIYYHGGSVSSMEKEQGEGTIVSYYRRLVITISEFNIQKMQRAEDSFPGSLAYASAVPKRLCFRLSLNTVF